jgi:hypothetical protein
VAGLIIIREEENAERRKVVVGVESWIVTLNSCQELISLAALRTGRYSLQQEMEDVNCWAVLIEITQQEGG